MALEVFRLVRRQIATLRNGLQLVPASAIAVESAWRE
jgi:hypothetical protein